MIWTRRLGIGMLALLANCGQGVEVDQPPPDGESNLADGGTGNTPGTAGTSNFAGAAGSSIAAGAGGASNSGGAPGTGGTEYACGAGGTSDTGGTSNIGGTSGSTNIGGTSNIGGSLNIGGNSNPGGFGGFGGASGETGTPGGWGGGAGVFTGETGDGSGSPPSGECVELPPMEARQPVLSFADACNTPAEQTPESLAVDDDARPALVGRWQRCGSGAGIIDAPHDGLEFGENGRFQMLELDGGNLVPIEDDWRGKFYLLASGQLELAAGPHASFLLFDATYGAMRGDLFPNGSSVTYARVAPDLASASANGFSTRNDHCSMVGTWDTSSLSVNPPASFVFDEQGEWFGGDRGTDLCDAHTMYGTYELIGSEFEIVTNVGAGLCSYWFSAGFGAAFNEDCSAVMLDSHWDNCTGGRGVLNWPGDILIRRN